MSYCANCGGVILEPNQNYGINPEAICRCCIHDRRVAVQNPIDANSLGALSPVRMEFLADKHMGEECTKWLAKHGHFEYSYIEAFHDGFRDGRKYEKETATDSHASQPHSYTTPL